MAGPSPRLSAWTTREETSQRWRAVGDILSLTAFTAHVVHMQLVSILERCKRAQMIIVVAVCTWSCCYFLCAEHFFTVSLLIGQDIHSATMLSTAIKINPSLAV